MASGLSTLKDKAAATALDGVFHHGYRWGMQIGLGSGFFKLCRLGRYPPGKKSIGSLIFFHHVQMFFYHGIKSLDPHQACPENRDVFSPVFEHFVGQGLGQAAHGEKGQGSVFKDFIGKLGTVGNIGHGSLDQGEPGALVLGKGGIRFHRIMAVDKIQVLANGFKKSGNDVPQTSGLFHKILGKNPVLAQIKQGLDKRGLFAVKGGHMARDEVIELVFPVRIGAQLHSLDLQVFDDFGAQLCKYPVNIIAIIGNVRGIALIQHGQKGFKIFRYRGLVGHKELAVHDQAGHACAEHPGSRVFTHAAMDENRVIRIFQIPLHEDKGGIF